MTIEVSLRSLTGYPLPDNTIARVGVVRGLSLDSDATEEILSTSAYRLATADVYYYLATAAPNVSQGGISYSFSAEERGRFLSIARAIYEEEGVTDASVQGTTYGYKGSRL